MGVACQWLGSDKLSLVDWFFFRQISWRRLGGIECQRILYAVLALKYLSRASPVP